MDKIVIYNKFHNFNTCIPKSRITIDMFFIYEFFYYLGHISKENLNKIIDALEQK